MIKWRWWDRFKRPIATLYSYANLGEEVLWYPTACESMYLRPVRAKLQGFNGSTLYIWWKNHLGQIVLVVHSTGR